MAPEHTDRTEPLRWGILGTARIAVHRVIPALQRAGLHQVVAIASRDPARAAAVARSHDIPRAHGSYEALLADPDVDAVYNPLPNHLHVPWSIRAAEAGKHVLCEKPIAMNAAEARRLMAVRDRTGVTMAEAFMVRVHPQWEFVRDQVRAGRLGELRLVTGHFSYGPRDPADVRSRLEYGGGVLLDIGCYPVTISRWLFGAEPLEVMALIERDPALRVDWFTSGMLRFPTGQCVFTVGGQLTHFQGMQMIGTTGRLEVRVPFNTPADHPAQVILDDGRDVLGSGITTTTFDPVDQYALQADRFADAIRHGGPVPVDLEDATANMAVIDALFRSAETRRWEVPR